MTQVLSVDGKKIDQALSEIAKLILRLSKKPKRDERLIKKITEIRDQIQDAIIQAKLKKSLSAKR
jgi:hypothetical protein